MVYGPSGRHDNLYSLPYQFRCHSGQNLRLAVGVTRLDGETLALDVAQLAHALKEGVVARGCRLARTEVEEPDAPDLALLAQGSERRYDHA